MRTLWSSSREANARVFRAGRSRAESAARLLAHSARSSHRGPARRAPGGGGGGAPRRSAGARRQSGRTRGSRRVRAAAWPRNLLLKIIAASVASANAAAKLGSEAVNVTAAGWVWLTMRVHHDGPTGDSHWYRQKPTAHASSWSKR